MKQNVKAAIEKVRTKAGLPVYEGPLTPATCAKCGRTYQWRVVPETCCWPGCHGKLKN